MKELSIEDKAKRYDEAIEIAKEINNEQRAQPFNVMTKVFPELKESDDEKVRKKLIEAVKGDMVVGGTKDKQLAIAWLEKQGEKGINGKNREIPFAEQNPAWSEEDEAKLKSILFHIEDVENKDVIDWLKSLKDRVQPQPQQEWSEEDEKMIQDIINDIAIAQEQVYCKSRCEDEINWLKSLKERYTWKPSEEQMEALAEALSLAKNCGEGWAFDIRTLYEQLEKLKG